MFRLEIQGFGERTYPDRRIPKPEHPAEMKKRTLTNLYNPRPAWLVNAHRALDEAVAAATLDTGRPGAEPGQVKLSHWMRTGSMPRVSAVCNAPSIRRGGPQT